MTTTATPEVLDILGRWFQAQRGATRSWRTCAARVERLYVTLSAWYGAGSVEVALLADPSGAFLDSLAHVVSNSDFTWSARRNRTAQERRAVMLGGTGHADRSITLTWLVPAKPLDPKVGRNLDWRGRELTAPPAYSGSLTKREYANRAA